MSEPIKMSSAAEAAQALEQVTQKNEKEIVIEFGSDRILHYIGVYLIAFLAVVAKISELAASNLVCNPAGNASMDGQFIAYATSYCWESSKIVFEEENTTPCATLNSSNYEDDLLKDPIFFKDFMQLLPYAMILEAFLFAIPSVWWHSRVGAKLMGHLKFMKLLITDIYEAVKPIKKGIYKTGDAYDSQSYYLDGFRGFQPNYRKEGEMNDPDSKPGCAGAIRRRLNRKKEVSAVAEATTTKHEEAGTDTMIELQGMSETNCDSSNNQEDCCTRVLYGEMRDRHLFSMLCFENFSSLEHHPYILSVYKLSGTPEEQTDKGFSGSKTKGILRLLCNKKNFGGRFLVKTYLQRHIIGTFVALVVLAASIGVLYKIGSDGWDAESFQCQIMYHTDVCMICLIRRKLDMVAFLIVNLCINSLYLCMSLMQLVFIRRSASRSTCHYFQEISDTGSAALRRAG